MASSLIDNSQDRQLASERLVSLRSESRSPLTRSTDYDVTISQIVFSKSTPQFRFFLALLISIRSSEERS